MRLCKSCRLNILDEKGNSKDLFEEEKSSDVRADVRTDVKTDARTDVSTGVKTGVEGQRRARI